MLLRVTKKSDVAVLLTNVRQFLKEHDISNKGLLLEIKTIVSELIYNIQKYTPKGSVNLEFQDKHNLKIEAIDQGSGIENFNLAIQDGYSTSGTLGLGFASIFRLSDEVEVQTSEQGTIINIKKRV
ncbi:ATP-binding protein [Halarcobacter anaerophilus]|jgi:serine/threonine-protein kinase RsbT|nr:ATP-binding protein [Halarcobacter anaerophilus]QDF30255.1 RsbW family anti-sigma regulatory factor (serine/threonine protein kinase) [Halarcobacter anaerophilus]